MYKYSIEYVHIRIYIYIYIYIPVLYIYIYIYMPVSDYRGRQQKLQLWIVAGVVLYNGMCDSHDSNIQ